MPLSDKDMPSSSDALFSDVMYFRLEALVILLVYFKGSVATVLHTITQAETNVVLLIGSARLTGGVLGRSSEDTAEGGAGFLFLPRLMVYGVLSMAW